MSEKALQEIQASMAQSQHYTIELDCPPGDPRPGDLIEGIIRDTGLPIRDPVSKVFGNWTWSYHDVEDISNLWTKIRPTLKRRIQTLYQQGVIRYGSW